MHHHVHVEQTGPVDQQEPSDHPATNTEQDGHSVREQLRIRPEDQQQRQVGIGGPATATCNNLLSLASHCSMDTTRLTKDTPRY
jgi:hypothetical protein